MILNEQTTFLYLVNIVVTIGAKIIVESAYLLLIFSIILQLQYIFIKINIALKKRKFTRNCFNI